MRLLAFTGVRGLGFSGIAEGQEGSTRKLSTPIQMPVSRRTYSEDPDATPPPTLFSKGMITGGLVLGSGEAG